MTEKEDYPYPGKKIMEHTGLGRRMIPHHPSITDPIGETNIPKTEDGFYFKDDFTCDTEAQHHQPTSESTTTNEVSKRFMRLLNGSAKFVYGAPEKVVHAVAVDQQQYLIIPLTKIMEPQNISTSKSVSRMMAGTTTYSIKVLSPALDAKVSITRHPGETVVLTVVLQKNENDSSTTRSNDNGTKTATTRSDTASTTRGKKSGTGSGSRSEKKRIVPIVAKPGGKESGTHNAMRTP